MTARVECLIPMPLQQILDTWMGNLGLLSTATPVGTAWSKWSRWDFLPARKTFLYVRQPSRLTAGLVWLPAWSNQTLLQVLNFLAVSLSPSSLICHGYLAFHGYFLKASEVCFAACMVWSLAWALSEPVPVSILGKTVAVKNILLT